MTKERVFAEGPLVLKAVDHIRRGMAGPSKFSPKWKGPLVIREAHASGYYLLAQMDGKDLMDPINGKWLKRYYAKKKKKSCSYLFCLVNSVFLFLSSK